MWGDINNPTFRPDLLKARAHFRLTDPLPLVPVMWIEGKEFWQLSNFEARSCIAWRSNSSFGVSRFLNTFCLKIL